MRILLWNIGYSRGYTGNPLEYLFLPHRLLGLPSAVFEQTEQAIAQLIKREDPDLVMLLEVRGKTRLPTLLKQYEIMKMVSKYDPSGIVRHLPFHRGNCNAVFTRKSLNPCIFPIYMHTGIKRLLLKIDLRNRTTFFCGHFALLRSMRRAQFAEVAAMVRGQKRTIVCGDFNLFSGERELQPFLDAGVQPASLAPTLPAYRPNILADLFLHTSDLQIDSCQVLRQTTLVSDHLPVLLSLKI